MIEDVICPIQLSRIPEEGNIVGYNPLVRVHSKMI